MDAGNGFSMTAGIRVGDSIEKRGVRWLLVLPLLLILAAAIAGFLWTKPGQRERHVQLRPFAGAGGPYEARLRAALGRAGVPLVTGGRDLAVGGGVQTSGVTLRLDTRFEDAREGRVVWRRVETVPAGDAAALDAAATRAARTVACGLAAFDNRRPPRPPASIPPLFRRCEAGVSRAAVR